MGWMSSPTVPILELKGLSVTLNQLVYQRLSLDQSPGKPHGFVYFLSIHNDSDVTVTIKGRKWVVAHEDGTTLVVEGDGVVGECPELAPGERFSYNSRHAIGTPTAEVHGSFWGFDSEQRRVFVRIPRFQLEVPPSDDVS
jgi:ApaG protein